MCVMRAIYVFLCTKLQLPTVYCTITYCYFRILYYSMNAKLTMTWNVTQRTVCMSTNKQLTFTFKKLQLLRCFRWRTCMHVTQNLFYYFHMAVWRTIFYRFVNATVLLLFLYILLSKNVWLLLWLLYYCVC